MYKNEFDTLLRQNKTFNAYMFFGTSTFLIEKYISLVINNHPAQSEIEKIYFEEYNFKYCQDKLLQSSLFSPHTILLIKTQKKIPKKEISLLIEACNINTQSTIIFACIGDTDFKTMATYFNAKTESISVRFFEPTHYEVSQILEKEAYDLNLSCDINTLNHLYFMHRQDLSLAVNDLKKLSILKEPISAKTIDKHCFGMGEVSLENFLFTLLENVDITTDLNALLEEGINDIYLLNQITSFIQQLFMINTYTRVNGVPNPREILGYIPPKNIWDRKVKLAINIKQKTFLKMFTYCNKLELELKSHKISNQRLYLQASIIKFSALFS